MGRAANGPAQELAEDEKFTAALDELWPILTPETLLAPLYASLDRLQTAGGDPVLSRTEGDAWTVSDVPLLDELADLLGRDKPAGQTAERERQAETQRAADVLDNLVSRQDSMDDEDHLYATDLLYAEDLATASSNTTPAASSTAPPQTATGPTATSSSTRPRNCPKWTGAS